MCYDNNTTEKKRKHENIKTIDGAAFLHRASSELYTIFVIPYLDSVSSTSSPLRLAWINGVSQQQNAEFGD